MATATATKKPRKVLDELRIKRAMDGGHVITHAFQGYHHDPVSYKFAKTQGAMAAAHIAKHTGIPMAAPATADEPEEAED
jgi:hypothetical protein